MDMKSGSSVARSWALVVVVGGGDGEGLGGVDVVCVGAGVDCGELPCAHWPERLAESEPLLERTLAVGVSTCCGLGGAVRAAETNEAMVTIKSVYLAEDGRILSTEWASILRCNWCELKFGACLKCGSELG